MILKHQEQLTGKQFQKVLDELRYISVTFAGFSENDFNSPRELQDIVKYILDKSKERLAESGVLVIEPRNLLTEDEEYAVNMDDSIESDPDDDPDYDGGTNQ